VLYVPQVVLEGEMDLMAPAGDITEQGLRLVNTHPVAIVYQSYSHMDFVSFPGTLPKHLVCADSTRSNNELQGPALSEPRAIHRVFSFASKA
jgi:hypothetical protein